MKPPVAKPKIIKKSELKAKEIESVAEFVVQFNRDVQDFRRRLLSAFTYLDHKEREWEAILRKLKN